MKREKIFMIIGMILCFTIGAITMMIFLKIKKNSDIIEKVIKEPLRFTKIQKTYKEVKNKPIQNYNRNNKKEELKSIDKFKKNKSQNLDKNLNKIFTINSAKSKNNTGIITSEEIRQLYKKRMEILEYLQ